MLPKAKRDAIRRHFRLLRIAIDKTQLEVEQEAGIAAGRYWQIENGVKLPEPDECRRLARVFRVRVGDLPTATTEPPKEAKAS